MTARTALVTDSTSNIPRSLAEERHIYMAPLYVLWGEKTYRDGIDINEAELFRKLRALGDDEDLPKTSQVSVQDFVEMFKQAREAENADEVVCTVLSSGMSGTYQSAMQAKEQVDFPVHVVDAKFTSWALGLPVLSGADARDQGASPAEVAEAIRRSVEHIAFFFTLENLHFLHRGGRIGNASHLFGTLLNIKPVLTMTDGIVTSADKVRTRKRAVQRLLTLAEKKVGDHKAKRLAVMHGDAEEEARGVLEKALAKFQPQEHFFTYATSVLGVHVGPGAIGLIVEWLD